jgi:ribosomal protein L29
MVKEEIQKLSAKELEKFIDDGKTKLTKLRIAAMMEKKAEKPHKFKQLRQQIARAHTELRQKGEEK